MFSPENLLKSHLVQGSSGRMGTISFSLLERCFYASMSNSGPYESFDSSCLVPDPENSLPGDGGGCSAPPRFVLSVVQLFKSIRGLQAHLVLHVQPLQAVLDDI